MSAKIRKDPLLYTRLGDYTIQDLLGRGGMARVYQGLDENLGRQAAVKVLEIGPDGEQDERILERFKLEARAIASFEHPNIITIYQYGEKDNLFFIAMKLVKGQTLSQVLRENRRTGETLPPTRVLEIVRDVCSALDYAHARGIIHRDIKPSNILFDSESNERAILTDFGLAMELGGDSTLGTAFGTPRYIAPEQAISSQKAVPQSDIYSLGVVIYEMLTGQVPFQDESPMSIALYHITSDPPPPRSLNPDIPPAVEAVILKALSKEPEARYATGQEFYQALEAAYRQADVEQPTPLLQPPPEPPSSSRPTPRKEKAPGNNKRPPRAKKLPRQKEAKAASPIAEPEPAEAAAPARQPLRRRRGRALVWPLLVILPIMAAGAFLALQRDGGASGSAGGGGNPAVVPPDVELTINLFYDEHSFVLQNPNSYPVTVDDLWLEWEGGRAISGARFHSPIPPGQCAWIRLLSDWQRNPPAACPASYHNLEMLSEAAEMFWTGDGLPDTFRVLQGEQELQTCSRAEGRCSFIWPH